MGYFLAAVLSFTLLKLMLKFRAFGKSAGSSETNKLTAKCLLIITAIIRYGKSSSARHQIDSDTEDRMMYVLNKLYLGNTNDFESEVMLKECRRKRRKRRPWTWWHSIRCSTFDSSKDCSSASS